MVLIRKINLCLQFNPREFPSPCGDYGSYQVKVFYHYTPKRKKFPSPCGDYGSYHIYDYDEYLGATECFRPLAGIMVLISRPTSGKKIPA